MRILNFSLFPGGQRQSYIARDILELGILS